MNKPANSIAALFQKLHRNAITLSEAQRGFEILAGKYGGGMMDCAAESLIGNSVIEEIFFDAWTHYNREVLGFFDYVYDGLHEEYFLNV